MKSTKSLMARAFFINISLYTMVYSMAYSVLNLWNAAHNESIHFQSIFVLLCCVMFRDTLAFIKTNRTYIISSLALFGFAFFTIDFIPASFDTFSLVGLLSSPILFFSLLIRMFDVVDDRQTIKN